MRATHLIATCFSTLAVFLVQGCATAGTKEPLRALLVIGGCCHEYGAQKDILRAGLERRVNVRIDVVYSSDTGTAPAFPINGPDYAAGYDVVIHDECAAAVSDPAVIRRMLAPHRAGIPAVTLHCAMHSFRVGNPAVPASIATERAQWFELLGLQSSGHGPQLPIEIRFTDADSPITRGMSGWTTGNEELYNNVQLFDGVTPLARGKQLVTRPDGTQGTEDVVVAWTNDYHGARVFNTTLGHNNATVADSRYLDLVARGLLWACGR